MRRPLSRQINCIISIFTVVLGSIFISTNIITLPQIKPENLPKIKDKNLSTSSNLHKKLSEFEINHILKRKDIIQVSPIEDPIKNYLEHEPININGNSNFIIQASREGWPGDGSSTNPIIIDGINITSALISIEIYNCDLYYQISNSIFLGEDGTSGIKLSDVSHGLITNNTFINGDTGIQVRDSSNKNIISNNKLENLTVGISIDTGSYNNTISFNQFEHVIVAAIYVTNESFNIVIDSNIIFECKEFGVLIDEFGNVRNNRISNNMIIEIVGTGIEIKKSSQNKLINNRIYGGGGGIGLDSSEGNLISSNLVWNVSCGINLSNANNTKVMNNSLYGNTETGLLIDHSNNNTFQNNRIFDNIGAIRIYYSIDNLFMNNTIHDHTDLAIYFDLSNHNNFSSNLISYTQSVGILVSRSHKNTFTDNLFWRNNYEGINFEFNSSNNLVSFNDFSENYVPYQQVADNGKNNVFVYNYWDSWITPDKNSDGIVDLPYPIEGTAENQDFYPLTTLLLNHSHLILPPIIIFPKGGEILNGTILIEWTSSVDSHKHEIYYSLFYSYNAQSWMQIGTELTTNSYQWDTTTTPDGDDYLIKVVVSCLEGLNATGISNSMFTIKNTIPGGLSELLMPLFFATTFFALGLGLVTFYVIKSKSKRSKSFLEYIQSDKLDFLKPLYHKVIIGLENIAMAMITEQIDVPILEPSEPISLVKYFPSDIREDLKSGMKARTILTLIEISYQYTEETHPMRLSKILNIPPSSLSNEITKLCELEYLRFYVSPKVLQDGRFRNYIVTPKGITFLRLLKGALEHSIRRLKQKKHFHEYYV